MKAESMRLFWIHYVMVHPDNTEQLFGCRFGHPQHACSCAVFHRATDKSNLDVRRIWTIIL